MKKLLPKFLALPSHSLRLCGSILFKTEQTLASPTPLCYITPMPPQHEQSQPTPAPKKPIEDIIDDQGLYPRDAFDFVRRGLAYTVENVHAELTDPNASRHVSGQQLCEGLREFALLQWGLLARTVLRRWNVTRTEDFGVIVFTLVESGEMSRTPDDTIEDFRNVYEFSKAFESAYRIECRLTKSRT